MSTTPAKPSSPSNPNNPIKVALPDRKPGFFQIKAYEPDGKDKFLKLMVYGKPGVGKTSLTASASDVEEMRDIILISAEGGTMVIDDNERIAKPEYLDIVRISKMEQLQKLYDFLQAHAAAWRTGNTDLLKNLQSMVFGMDESLIDSGPKAYRLRKFKTVIIDSLTEIEMQNLDKILGYDDSLGLDEGSSVNTAQFADFKKNNNIVQRIVRSFRDLDMHILIVCAENFTQDESKRISFSPMLTGKLAQQVQGFMDVVGYMVNSTNATGTSEVRKLYVQPVAQVRFAAKNRRAGTKEIFFENPTMLSLMEAFKLI